MHTTILRKLKVFEEVSQGGTPLAVGPDAEWKDFIAKEERRRTAMACFGE